MKFSFYIIILFLVILPVIAVDPNPPSGWLTPTPLSLEVNQIDGPVQYISQYFIPPPSGSIGIFTYDSSDKYYSNMEIGGGLFYTHTTHTLSVDASDLGLGTAAFQPTSAFATSTQGSKADSALQSGAIGSTVQGYSSILDTFASNGSSYYTSRSNQTGSQAASTISDFSSVALSTVTWSTLTGKPSFSTIATSGSYSDLTGTPSIPAAQVQSDWSQIGSGSLDFIKNKPTIPTVQAYEGTNQRLNVFPIFKSVTVSSGTAIFYLTNDNTSSGASLFPNGIIADSVNATVNDATASYQMSWVFTNSNKTLTITANKLTTANILTGILGQSSANSAVVKLQVWGY